MRFRLFVICLFMLIPFGSLHASEFLQGSDCEISEEEVVNGTLYAICRTLTVAGEVRGDILGAAVNVTISGQVQGSTMIAAGKLEVSGEIAEDVIFFGGILHITSDATLKSPLSTVYSAALSTQIDARVPGNVGAIGYQLLIYGTVGGNVDFSGTTLRIAAPIGGDVTASVGDRQSNGVGELQTLIQLVDSDVTLQPPGLIVLPEGWIGGTLRYRSPSEGEILGHVTTIVYERVIPDTAAIASQQDIGGAIGEYLRQVLREFLTLAIIGVVVVTLAPRSINGPISIIRYRTLTSIGLGLLIFILSFPMVLISILLSLLIILIISLLGVEQITLIITLVMVAINFSGAVMFYFIALFFSRALVATAIGRAALSRVYRPKGRLTDSYIYLLAGAFLLSLVIALPYIGTVVTGAAAFLGLGALVLNRQRLPKRQPAATQGVRAGIGRRPEIPQLPPPLESPPGPGTERLPDGFNWWQ
ncbi:MAG: hypothetical protein IAE89_01020 [Anaerolineae bacterium]|nr:hypothetical protein [Anaerolineae bacterium]